MQVYNVVKFKVKSGEEAAFLMRTATARRNGRAWSTGPIIKTGEQTFCLIGTWSSQEAMVAARPAMIKTLDSFRLLLEDQGGGRGLTDAVSAPSCSNCRFRETPELAAEYICSQFPDRAHEIHDVGCRRGDHRAPR